MAPPLVSAVMRTPPPPLELARSPDRGAGARRCGPGAGRPRPPRACLQHLLVLLPRRASRYGYARLEERRTAPLSSHSCARARGDDLLRQHIQRLLRDAHHVQLALAHGVEPARRHSISSSRVIANRTPLGDASFIVAGAAHPLQAARRWTLVVNPAAPPCPSLPDVDAQLQRRGGHHRHGAGPLFSRSSAAQADLPRHAAVVRRHLVLADPLSHDRAPPARPSSGC